MLRVGRPVFAGLVAILGLLPPVSSRGVAEVLAWLGLARRRAADVPPKRLALAREAEEGRFPEARCLDGSPARYYFREGVGEGRKKFLIFFEGGGFCDSDHSCAERAKGSLGSTRRDSRTKDLEKEHHFFSTSERASPLLWNWNHVFVRYCDGAYMAGEQLQPKLHRGRKLYFRGRQNTEFVLQDLKSVGLAAASDVVFSGCSAGAIRVFAHLDALRAMLPQSVRVAGFPDSGFYLDVPMFTSAKRYPVFEQHGVAMLNKACRLKHVGEEEKCLIGEVVAPFLETPLFAWQSRYDLDQRSCEMNATCARSGACLEDYGARFTATLQRQLLQRLPAAAGQGHGAFLDSCSRHCDSNVEHAPLDDASGETPLQAFAAWYGHLAGGSGSGEPSPRQLYGQAPSLHCEGCCGTHAFTNAKRDAGTIYQYMLIVFGLLAGPSRYGVSRIVAARSFSPQSPRSSMHSVQAGLVEPLLS